MTAQITAEVDADIRRTEGMRGSSQFDSRTLSDKNKLIINTTKRKVKKNYISYYVLSEHQLSLSYWECDTRKEQQRGLPDCASR